MAADLDAVGVRPLAVGVVDHAHGQPQDALLDRLERGEVVPQVHGVESVGHCSINGR